MSHEMECEVVKVEVQPKRHWPKHDGAEFIVALHVNGQPRDLYRYELFDETSYLVREGRWAHQYQTFTPRKHYPVSQLKVLLQYETGIALVYGLLHDLPRDDAWAMAWFEAMYEALRYYGGKFAFFKLAEALELIPDLTPKKPQYD